MHTTKWAPPLTKYKGQRSVRAQLRSHCVAAVLSHTHAHTLEAAHAGWWKHLSHNKLVSIVTISEKGGKDGDKGRKNLTSILLFISSKLTKRKTLWPLTWKARFKKTAFLSFRPLSKLHVVQPSDSLSWITWRLDHRAAASLGVCALSSPAPSEWHQRMWKKSSSQGKKWERRSRYCSQTHDPRVTKARAMRHTFHLNQLSLRWAHTVALSLV